MFMDECQTLAIKKVMPMADSPTGRGLQRHYWSIDCKVYG